MGLGGRGGGCRSPSLITYCSRLTSRAHESAQLCTCTTLLEQRSSNSGWLWGAGGAPHQSRRHPRHTQIGPGQIFPGLVSLLPNSSTERRSKQPGERKRLRPGLPREAGARSPRESIRVPSNSSFTSAWLGAAGCYLHVTEEEAGPTKAYGLRRPCFCPGCSCPLVVRLI